MRWELRFLSAVMTGVVLSGQTSALAPAVEQEAKLLASDGAYLDELGESVAVEGDIAIIGVPDDDDHGLSSGSAYVFTRTGGVWIEEVKLLPADGAAHDEFGLSVALDGDTAIIGARLDDDNGTSSGSAYVFTRTGSEWTAQSKLLPADGTAGDFFGASIALDGDTVVIGAPGDGENGFQSGSAYVFTRTGNMWVEQAKLLPADGEFFDQFGLSVAVERDTAVIGVNGDDDNGSRSGSARVYVRTGGVWAEQAQLRAADGAAHDEFGSSVAVGGDTALIGAPLDDDNGVSSGSAYVFSRKSGAWTERAKLLPSDGEAYDTFGNSIALSGSAAVIGALGDEHAGSAYLFTRTLGVWTEQEKAAGDWDGPLRFGWSIALHAATAVIGAPGDIENGTASGSVYVFRLILPDADGDGIDDDVDDCPDTLIPESVPRKRLGVNRWALVDEDGTFDTHPAPGGGPGFAFTIEETAGCSCEQILEATTLGAGHSQFGCSTGAMLHWIGTVARRP